MTDEEPTQAQQVGAIRGRSVAQLTFTGGDAVRPRAIVFVWRARSPWVVAAYGPFVSKAEARRWGRAEYPRHHVVVGLHTPPEASVSASG